MKGICLAIVTCVPVYVYSFFLSQYNGIERVRPYMYVVKKYRQIMLTRHSIVT